VTAALQNGRILDEKIAFATRAKIRDELSLQTLSANT
jgi:hypothetical protein